MEESNLGVNTEGGASSAGGDSGSPVVPQTTESAIDNSTAGGAESQATVDSQAPPAAAQDVPENDDDLSTLPETERTPLINQRNRIRELNKWRTEAEPIKTWVDERGGMDYVRSDVEMVDNLFSAKVEDRQQFYANLAQDSVAFEAVLTDFVSDPMVQQRTLDAIPAADLLRYVEESGLLPQGYGSQIDPAILATIPNELQEVFRALPAAVQEDYALQSAELRNWNLRRDAQLHQGQKAEQQRAQREQQQQQQQRTQAIQGQKTKTYNDVRSIIQQSISSIFPGNEQATNFVLSATEAALYSSPEGAALWNELEACIEGGQAREVRQKLPLLIAKAKSVATQQAQWLNERESKARQFDELMTKVSQDEILTYIQRVRGGMRQPSQGTTPQPTNGAVPNPDKVGQFARENVLSYHPAHQRS